MLLLRRRRAAQRAAIDRLPVELLIKILTFVTVDSHVPTLLPPRADDLCVSRIALAQVCSAWRDAVYDTASFWSSFKLGPLSTSSEASALFAKKLAQWNAIPLRVELDLLVIGILRALGGSRALPLLRPHLDRLVALDICIKPSVFAMVGDDDDNSWFHKQGIIFPQLQYLRVADAGSSMSMHIVAPRLQELHLERIDTTEWDAVVNSGLRVLDLSGSSLMMQTIIELNKATLLHILSRCPSLHTLLLRDIHLIGTSNAVDQPYLPALQVLECTRSGGGVDGDILLFLLDIVPWQQLALLAIDPGLTDVFLTAGLGGVMWTSLRYCSSLFEGEMLMRLREFGEAGDGGRERRVQRSSINSIVALLHSTPAVFTHLRELHVDLLGFVQLSLALSVTDQQQPFFASVTLLTVLLRETGRIRRNTSGEVTNLRDCLQDHLEVMRLPALQTLRLSAVGAASNAVYIASACIEEFISALGCSAKPRVELDNIGTTRTDAVWTKIVQLSRIMPGVTGARQ